MQSAVLACPGHRQSHELDVVVVRKWPGESDTVLAIGEAKSTQAPVGDGELDRLEHLRSLIPTDRVDRPPRLLLFSRSGFTDELRRRSGERRDVELVDMARLCTGD
jgi:hypothetical protein